MAARSRETVGYILRQANIALSRALQRRLARYQLTSPQMIFMREIWLEEGLSQRELSERVGTAASTTVAALRVLERRKLIRRVAKPLDRRAIRVFLTPKGRWLEREVVPKIYQVNDRVIARLSRRELATLDDVLRKIRDNADVLAATRATRRKRRRA